MLAKTRKVGRPPVDTEEVRSRIPRELLDRLDAWRHAQPDRPNRPEAIRRLLAERLAHAAPETGT